MNRSALCIRMLNLLNARGLMSREALASELDTNIRNIAEFKKELETAGYAIESVSGKNGGYRLIKEKLFPGLALSDEEIAGINEALKYLKVNHFAEYRCFEGAMDKLKAGLHNPQYNENIHYLYSGSAPSKTEEKMRQLLQKAANTHYSILMNYRSLKGKQKPREIQPYEIINTKDGYYVLAYDISADTLHSYKSFKIIDSRMSEVSISNHRFTRDLQFKFNDFIGEAGLFKTTYSADLVIDGEVAFLINENTPGIANEKCFKNNQLFLKITFENEAQLKRFILSLGQSCLVKAPDSLRAWIKAELKTTLSRY